MLTILTEKIRENTLWGSVLLYAVSLFCPALIDGGNEPSLGIAILLSGWLGIFISTYAWFANLFFYASIKFFLRRKYIIAGNLAAIAVILGLTSFFIPGYINFGPAGTSYMYVSIGFYIWILSFMILLFSSFYLGQFKNNQTS